MFGGVAAAAAVRTFPFRVFSFPKQIVVAPPPLLVPISDQQIYFPGDLGITFVDAMQNLELFWPAPDVETRSSADGWQDSSTRNFERCSTVARVLNRRSD